MDIVSQAGGAVKFVDIGYTVYIKHGTARTSITIAAALDARGGFTTGESAFVLCFD